MSAYDLIVNTLVSTGFFAFIVYICRSFIKDYASQIVVRKFEKEMEKFRSELRGDEGELGEIRSFLMKARSERSAILQVKKLEAAEAVIAACHNLAKLTFAVEIVKILDFDKILKNNVDYPFAEAIEKLTEISKVDDFFKSYSNHDMGYSRLYLSDEALEFFDLYQTIMCQAAIVLKVATLKIDGRSDAIPTISLRERIIKRVPSSREGFEQWGDAHAFFWHTYFKDELVKALRVDISGMAEFHHEIRSAEQIAIDARTAQARLKEQIGREGLQSTLQAAAKSSPSL